MSPSTGQRAHSAVVEMDLILDPSGSRRVVPIAQLAPDFLIAAESIEHPPTEAEIVYRVDGHERRWRVLLPEGVQAGSRVTPLVRAA